MKHILPPSAPALPCPLLAPSPTVDLVIYKMGGDDELRRVLEMVGAAVRD